MIYIYHNKTEIFNEALKTHAANDYSEENKIKDKEMEDSGSIKVEHGKLDSRRNTEEMNAAATTTPNINIVIYSLPLSLLSPIVFPVYVIQVSQSYVTL